MKAVDLLKVAVIAVPLMLTGCHTKKKVIEKPETPVVETEGDKLMDKVNSKDNADMQYVSSKLKFSVELGQQKMALTGNLRMKRNEVIQMQLMAFGFVEAARIEFTQDYVLIIDRINKQYLQAPYNYVSFLRNSGINFFTLQSLFWNELFLPGRNEVTAADNDKFKVTSLGNGESILEYTEGNMDYSWLASDQSGSIKMSNITHHDRRNGNSKLTWEYSMFGTLARHTFPTEMAVTLALPEKEIKMNIRLNHLTNDSEWEPRTTVSRKYRVVEIDEILRRFMAM